MNLPKIQDLDIQEIGSWPGMYRAIVILLAVVAVCIASYYLVLQEQVSTLLAEEDKEVKLKADYQQKISSLSDIESRKRDLAQLQQSLATLLKQLPTENRMDALIAQISQLSASRGLRTRLLRPATANEAGNTQKQPERDVTSQVVNLQFRGHYHDLAAFAFDLAQQQRILILQEMELTQSTGGSFNISATTPTLTSHRALPVLDMTVQLKVPNSIAQAGAKQAEKKS